MHPHHARALRVARRNYNAAGKAVEAATKLYLNARGAYVYNVYTQGLAPQLAHVKAAKERLELTLEIQLDMLSVLMTVERMLEKA